MGSLANNKDPDEVWSAFFADIQLFGREISI